MSEITFRQALGIGLLEAMEADDDVILLGEDIAAAGGVFKVTEGLHERFGGERVIDTPISELALAGAAFGASVTGSRPVIEIMFGDFMALPMDALVNQAAKHRYLSRGSRSAALVVRTAVGPGGGFGAIHSQHPGPWLLGVPGLKLFCPATVPDARALIRAAIEDPDPVVFLEHKRLYTLKGELTEVAEPIGRAAIRRRGADLTIAATMRSVHEALEAADVLARDGIEAEVVDMRSLRPLDVETVLGSVARTNRLLAIEEGPALGGWAASLLAAVAEEGLGDLDELWSLAAPDMPVPFSPPLEQAYLPGADAIARSVRERLNAAAPQPSARPR